MLVLGSIVAHRISFIVLLDQHQVIIFSIEKTFALNAFFQSQKNQQPQGNINIFEFLHFIKPNTSNSFCQTFFYIRINISQEYIVQGKSYILITQCISGYIRQCHHFDSEPKCLINNI